MSDVERWPEWTSTVTRIERLDRGRLTVGSRARIWQPKLRPAVWEVTELLDGRSFTWVTRAPGVRVVAQHAVEGTPQGTRATLSVRFAGLLGWLAALAARRLNQRYLAIEAQGLRDRCSRWRVGLSSR